MLNIYGLFLGILSLLYRYVTNVHVSCLRSIVPKSHITKRLIRLNFSLVYDRQI